MTNDTNNSRSDDEILRTPLVSSTNDTLPDPVWFYFENHSFLLQKVQPLLFIEQLYQLPQPHIEKRTLIITNRI